MEKTNCHELAKRYARLLAGMIEVQAEIKRKDCDLTLFASAVGEELRALGASEEFVKEAIGSMGVVHRHGDEIFGKVEELKRFGE